MSLEFPPRLSSLTHDSSSRYLESRLDGIGIQTRTYYHEITLHARQRTEALSYIPDVSHVQTHFLRASDGKVFMLCTLAETKVQLRKLAATLEFNSLEPLSVTELFNFEPGAQSVFCLTCEATVKGNLKLYHSILFFSFRWM